jgi:hypothetical protein
LEANILIINNIIMGKGKSTHTPTIESLHARLVEVEKRLKQIEAPINTDDVALRSEQQILAKLKTMAKPSKVERAVQLIRKYQKNNL